MFVQLVDGEVMCRQFRICRCVLCNNLFNGLVHPLVLGSKVCKLVGACGDGCDYSFG